MKKQFAKLSKAEQEKVELEYHRMKPEDFEKAMSRAKRATAIPGSKRKNKPTEKKRAA
ncbi:MAG: hypothetical protein ACMG6H_02445 [Acidobacteriota bacterium]